MAYNDYGKIAFKNGRHIKDLSSFEKSPYIFGGMVDLNIDRADYTEYIDFDTYEIGYYNSEISRYGHRAGRSKMAVGEYFIYKCPEYNAIFHINSKSGASSVILSGSKYYGNPFLHFYDKGYGEEHDKRLLDECYFWLCSKVMNQILGVLVVDRNTHPYCIEKRVYEALRFNWN